MINEDKIICKNSCYNRDNYEKNYKKTTSEHKL